MCHAANDLTIGWQNLNLLGHPNATLAPEARQARPSGENLNYVTLAPQVRQARPSSEILNHLLSQYSDILSKIIAVRDWWRGIIINRDDPRYSGQIFKAAFN